MATNLAIDDRLLEEARKIGGHRTRKATVTEALEEYITASSAGADSQAFRRRRV
jgi:Arc/MetJ family transcription regulator